MKPNSVPTMKRLILGTLVIAAGTLAACGGGGGITPGGGPSPTVSPTQTATPTPPPTTTQASGTVVDDASGSPLAGVQVALMAWPSVPPTTAESAMPTPYPVATTNAQGQFTFSAPNGHYILVIGSNSPSDTRATVHDNTTLTGGTQPLEAPTAWPIPDVTPPPSELTHNYRLQTLDTTRQTPCLSEVNVDRAKLGLQPVVPDEWLEENAIEYNDAQIINITGAPAGTQPNKHGDADSDTASCAAAVDQADFSGSFPFVWAGYALATSPQTIWFGGSFGTDTTPGPFDGTTSNTSQWGYDPRLDNPCPAGDPTPAPSNTLGSCDPIWEAWP